MSEFKPKFDRKWCSKCMYRSYLHTTASDVHDIYCGYHKVNETETALKRGPKGTIIDSRGEGGKKKCKLYSRGNEPINSRSGTSYLFVKEESNE